MADRGSTRVPPLVRGSVVVQRRRCGKANCHCAAGEALHETTALSYSQSGRTRTLMLDAADVAAVARAVARYRSARARLDAQADAGLTAPIGAWAMDRLWQVLAVHAITRFAPTGVVSQDLDDTLFHRDGRHVAGAGTFRDAVRSTLGRVVYARGLNLVVLTLRVQAPWGRCPIAVPINVALHKKKDDTTTVEHAAVMVRELADWLPERHFHLCADGAYASLAGADLPRTHLTSRIRRDAALYQAAPPRTGKTRAAPHQRRPATHPTRARQGGPPEPVAQGQRRHPRHHSRAARLGPRRALVRRQQGRPGPPGHRPRPRRGRTRRLLHHHRPERQRRPDRHPLRRPMVRRSHLPRRQTRPRRARPPVLETPRPRTRRRTVAVATRPDLVLVPPGPPHRKDLDPTTLVPDQDHPQLPGRTRRPTQSPLVPTNYNHVSSPRREPQIHRGPTRHARLRRLNLRKSTCSWSCRNSRKAICHLQRSSMARVPDRTRVRPHLLPTAVRRTRGPGARRRTGPRAARVRRPRTRARRRRGGA